MWGVRVSVVAQHSYNYSNEFEITSLAYGTAARLLSKLGLGSGFGLGLGLKALLFLAYYCKVSQ